VKLFVAQGLPLISNRLALSASSPEKAGVGGSIPSLATISTLLKSTFFMSLHP
jgi:hypothetical protein